MMHTLRNRKTGRKSSRWRFTEARRTSETAFIRISQAPSGTLIQVSRPFWASKRECDAHICLNLGFTSQNFRLSQVSLHVCYFWLSSFRMDEGNALPSEHGLCHKGSSVQIKPPLKTLPGFHHAHARLQFPGRPFRPESPARAKIISLKPTFQDLL